MKRKMNFLVIATLGLLIATTQANAVVIDKDSSLIPLGFGPGDSFQLVFVTSTKVTPDSLDGAIDGTDNTSVGDWNAHVNAVAASSALLTTNLPGANWSAIVSVDNKADNQSGIAAKDNALVGAAVFRTDGEQVATGFADFWDSSLLNPIKTNEFGLLQDTNGGSGSGRLVWTGSNGDGTIDFRPLGNPASNTGNFSIRTGNADSIDDNWINTSDATRRGPGTSLRVYALSEIITVATVPEPATATLALVGLGGLVMRRRRSVA